MNKAMNIALSVLFLLGLVFMQNAFASDQPVIRPEQAQLAAQRMIPAISDGFQRKNKAQLSQDWRSAKAGDPLLVHNTQGQPCYYIVPIAQNGQMIATMGISAFKEEWQWYTEEYKHSKFPPVSAAEAQASVGGHIQKMKISGAASAPVLASMPDKRLYWVFSITENNKTTRRLCVDYVNKARMVAAEDIKGSSDPDSRQSGGGISAMTEPDMMDASALASTNDPKGTIPGVPHYYQWKTYYCGEGSLDMVFDYIGPRINQYQIGNVARANSSYGSYTDDLRRASHFSNLSTSVGTDAPGYGCTGYTGRGLGYGAFEYTSSTFWLTDLKKLIDSSYAISILTWYDLNHYSGHFRTVIGYDNTLSEVIVHDPWNTAWGGAYGGPNVHFSNSTFQNLWSYYYYWGLFIQPWRLTVTSPASVNPNTTFTVSASVKYPCPYPFGTSYYPASSSQATITLPANLALATGETATKTIGALNAGASANVSWQVKAVSPGQANLLVSSEGRVSGSVSAHGPYSAYSYTDRIGGEGSKSLTVNTPWTVKYEADQLPDAATPPWTYTVYYGSPSRSVSGGILTQYSPAYSGWQYRRDWGASDATGITILARFKVAAGSEPQEIRVHDGSYYISLYIYDYKLQFGSSNYTLDNKVYHVYRITLKGGAAKLYVDEGSTPVLQLTASSNTQNYIALREPWNTSSSSTMYLDYFYYSTAGAYGPGSKAGDELSAEKPATNEAQPAATLLLTSSPNPALNGTTIRYQVFRQGAVRLAVYNISGQLVKVLLNESKPAGHHSVRWNGRDANGKKAAAGVYLYRMETGDYSKTNKLTVLR